MSVSKSELEEIKNKISLSSELEKKTRLIKKGKDYWCCCLFHQEKTPSFFVFPDRQSWRCFGACATGGDVFSFVMKTRDIEFGEALRTLAEQTNITLPNQNDTSQNGLILSINESANSYFQQYLASSLGTSTRQYLDKRSINGDSLNKFELGLSPPDGESLKNHLLKIKKKKKKQFVQKECLFVRKNNQLNKKCIIIHHGMNRIIII
mgnify:CR=1 FL=1